jgi:putative nucleotidyltransferase with HDIG domain
VETVLRGTLDLVPCEAVGICRLDWLGAREGHLRVALSGEPDIDPERNVTLSFQDQGRLTDGTGVFEIDDPERMAAYFGEGLKVQEGAPSGLVAPLHLKEGLAGYIAVVGKANSEFTRADLDHFNQVAEQLAVALANAQLLEELERMNWGALTALARAIDAKSPWTLGHSERVTAMSVALARFMGLDESQVLNLQRGGLVHDLGKLAVPESILDKNGRLNEEEYDIIKSHPEAGVRILEPVPAMDDIIPIILYHHEDWDGSGYPAGLAGEAIPFLARLLAVADRFDALTSDRPYRGAWPVPDATAWIREQSGTGLDPDIVQAFLTALEEGKLPLVEAGKETVSV